MGPDVRVRWLLDVVDRGGPEKLLRQDRTLRRSLEQTDKQYHRTATSATSAASRQAAASQRVRRAQETEGRATSTLSRDVGEYARAQERALGVGRRVIAQTSQIERAYDRQTGAMRRQAREQQSIASRARRVGGGALAGAAAGGRALGGAGLVAGAAAGFGLAAAARDAVGFEKQMANVQARLLTTGGNMRRLSNFALELGAKTQFSAGQAAAAMDELAAQGFSVKQIFGVLPGTLNLAAASGTDLANAATIQAAALRGFGLEADQAGRVADVLAQTANRSAVDMDDLGETLKYISPVAKATGQSFESMLAAVGLMGNVGIKGSQAGTTLRTALVRLTNPTEKARGALETLHIEADKLRGPKGLLPIPQIMAQIVKGSQGVSKGTRNAAIATIFGREALSGMVALIEGGPKKFAKMQAALEHSGGAAKRAASIMRNTVSGAWDNFTGSVETAAIKLTRRFMPAVKGALNAAAGGVNKGVSVVGDVIGGVTGAGRRPPAPHAVGRATHITDRAATDPSTATRVGQKIGQVARQIGTVAATAGRQLLEAFRPALPFFQNVLLPLLTGIGKGVLVSIVGAFKVAIPVIHVVASIFGAVGKAAKPFRPIIEGIGMVIGVVFSGPILKAIGALGKLGGIFRLVGAAARLVSAPVRAIDRAFGLVIKGVGRLIGRFGSLPGTLSGLAGRAAGFVLSKLGAIGSKVGGLAMKIVTAYVRAITFLPRKLAGAVAGIAGRLAGVGKSLVSGIVGAIKSAPGAIIDAIKSLVPGGALKKIAKHIPGNPLHLRRGGRAYGDGGYVDAMVSPGEAIRDPSGAWFVVPGARAAGDTVAARLRVGSAVLTDDGQRRMAEGASLGAALASQRPHFARGGRVRPLIGDAFSQGYDYGRDPTSGGSLLSDVLDAALMRTESNRRKSRARSAGGGITGTGTARGHAAKLISAMVGRAKKFVGGPYDYGGGHGSFGARGGRGGFDCSGYVSAILGPSVLSSPMAVREPMASHLQRGAGRWVTVGIRGSSGKSAHTMLRIGQSYWESGGGHGAARVGGWNGSFENYHPRGLRRGGRVGYQHGGRVGRLIGSIDTGSRSRAANVDVRHALKSLDAILVGATYTRIGAIAASIRAQIRHLLRGSEDAAQKRAITRLRGALSLAEHAAGVRVGRIVRRVEGRQSNIELSQTAADWRMRAGGIDPGGPAGLAIGGENLGYVRTSLEANQRDLHTALRRARAHHDSKTVADVTQRIRDGETALGENWVQMVENQRASILAVAQQQADRAQFGVDVAQSSLGALDVAQRLGRTGDTPGGMRERAAAIQANLLPALTAQRDAAIGNYNAAMQVGDETATRQAFLAVQQAGQDIGAAMADAADLIRSAAEQAAQDTVDRATHGTTMASLGLQRLELEQRIAGTYDTGGTARADYIRRTLIPSLNAELEALRKQADTARAQGDPVLAEQVAESIAGKQNEILQANVDATEEVASNTDPSRRFGGTLGYGYGGETITDALISVGNGA